MNLSNSEAMTADNILNQIANKVVDSMKTEFGNSPIECLRFIQSLRDRGIEITCLLYTSPSPRDRTRSRMPSSA